MSYNNPQFIMHNNLGPSGPVDGVPYTGPVPGIQTELDANGPADSSGVEIWSTPATPDCFIVTGSGNDGIDLSGDAYGGNMFNAVVDAGGGSNFVTASQGTDTLYLDGRGDLGDNIWSTFKNTHAGDAVTVWGVNAADFSLTWLNDAGAGVGNSGLTAVFTNNAHPTVGEIGVTIAGWGLADLNSGHIGISYGVTASQPGAPGSDYFHIQLGT